MDRIESIWKIGIRYNEVQFIGMSVIIDILDGLTERALISKAVDYMCQAKRFADCTAISELPEDMTPSNNNVIMVGFTVRFNDVITAQRFIERLKK